MMLSSVDLPQPEWPMIETYSPLSIVSMMSFSTSVSRLPRLNDLVDVIDLEISHGHALLSLRCVPRVTMLAMKATRRSSTKPTTPM